MIQSFLSDVIEQSLDELKLKNIILTAPISANKLDNLLKSKFGGDRYTADLSSDISFGDFCANITNLDDNSVIVIKNINNADEEFTKLLTHLLAKRQIHVIIGEDNLKKDVFLDIAECSFIALLHEFESINHPLSEYFNIQINLSSKDIPEPIGYSNLSGTTKDNQTDVNFSGEDNSDGKSRNMIVWHIDDAVFNFDDESGRNSWVAGGKKVSFEFDPSNSDDGGDALFDDPSAASQYFELNTNNSVLQIIEEADSVRISAWIDIALTLKDGIDEDEFYDWANNYGGVYCSTITLNDCDSSISGDSGQEFRWNSAAPESIADLNGEDVNFSSEDISDRSTRNLINSVSEIKIKLNLTIKNSDSYEEEACELIERVTNKELHLADKLNKLISDGTVKSFAKFYVNFIGDKLQKIESPFYDGIFSKLTSIAWDNYGWNDVVVEFASIEVDGKSFSWEDDDDIELINTLKIQLAHGADDEEPFMYFVG